MSPQAEEIFAQVIDEVHKKSVCEARFEGRQEGRQEGREEGRDKAKEEIAINLKDVFDDEEISKRTGLSLERVKQL